MQVEELQTTLEVLFKAPHMLLLLSFLFQVILVREEQGEQEEVELLVERVESLVELVQQVMREDWLESILDL